MAESLLAICAPVLHGKAFAIGDTCVAALLPDQNNHGNIHLGNLEFAAFRPEFDNLVSSLMSLAEKWNFQLNSLADNQMGHINPYLCLQVKPDSALGDDFCPTELTEPRKLTLYALDKLPEQIPLRLRVFKEAKKATNFWEKAVSEKNLPAIRKAEKGFAKLRRFENLDTEVYGVLMGIPSAGDYKGNSVFMKSYESEMILPLREAYLFGSNISLPRNARYWFQEPTPERQRITEIVQNEELDCLDELDRVCKQLQLNYFLVGGTLLGAVRHQGFIPWDDDVDIGMLRPDYERLQKSGESLLATGFSLQNAQNDPHLHYVYSRLRKKGYNYITDYNEHRSFDKGIWIDIFPFDVRPQNQKFAKIQARCVDISVKAVAYLKRRQEYAQDASKMKTTGLCVSDYYFLHLNKILATFYPVWFWRFVYNISARLFNSFRRFDSPIWYASFTPNYTWFESDELLDYRTGNFAGRRLPIPKQPEAFLRRQYGNFWQLPPIRERLTEHGFKYLETEGGTRFNA